MDGTILASGACASSHTYGNVASLVQEYICAQFPPDFFKYKHISTSLVTREQRKKRVNSDIEMIKQGKPAIIFKPLFEPNNDDVPFSGTQLTAAMGGTETIVSRRFLQQFVKDMDNGLEIRFKMNRDKITFDVTLYLDSQVKQLDVFKHMQNHMNWWNKFYIHTHLESMIPREMIYHLAKINNIDMNQPGASTLILNHLNKNNNTVSYPVTYKMRTATANDEYFLYYDVNVEMNLIDLEMDTPVWKNQSVDYAAITFRCECQFNLPGMYYMIGTKKKHSIVGDICVDSGSLGKDYIPIFTIDRLYDIDNDRGFKIYNNTIIKTEAEIHEDDSYEFKELFTREFLNLINLSNAQGIDINNYLEIKMIKNRQLLIQGQDYDLDWDAFNITIHDSDPDATYRLIIFFENGYVNDRLVRQIEEDDYDMGLQRKNESRN